MVQERVTGNGNFDIDAIRMAADAYGRLPISSARIANADQFTAEEQRAISAILEIVADFSANRSAGSGNELEAMLVTNIAAKLPAGTHSQIIGEIYREVERRDRSGFSEFGSEQWERVKKEAQEEREKLDKIADMADDAQNAQQLSTTPDRYGMSEQNYADLNSELRTRDGQERYMAFLRLLYPNMTDGQIRERVEKTEALAARNSNQPLTERQQSLLQNMHPAEEADISRDANRYREAIMENGNAPLVADRNDVQTTIASAETVQISTYSAARSDLLSGGSPSIASTDQATLSPSRTSVASQIGDREVDSSASSLRRSFVDANAATAPLDVRQPQVASAASVAPTVSANAGLDV